MVRNTYIYPPTPSMRICADIIQYTSQEMPKFNSISISGYHMQEAGATTVQELAFTIADGLDYVRAALSKGLDVDAFAGRLSFYWCIGMQFYLEIAKMREGRRIWAERMRDLFAPKQERSLMLRTHSQTSGASLTEQDPMNNVIRTTIEAMAAVFGGTQSLHTNGFDEALALPSERAAKIALRTQQIVAHESGAADTVDPFAGSYFVEALTDEIEERARGLIGRVDELGGSVNAIGFIKTEIEESAFGYHERYRTGQDVVVGVNRYEEDDAEVEEILRVDPGAEQAQVDRLRAFKAGRDQELAATRLEELRAVCRGDGNLLPPIRQALKDSCSLGEVCGAMRDVFGEYRGGAFF
jgi:methylmalonyl-CoA mutase N-terminal domain/subunit